MYSSRTGIRGFTIIELLVVIAIIAVLTSVVLASVNNARNKGVDSSVKANLGTVATQATLFFDTNNGSYGTPVTTCIQTAGNGTLFGDVNIAAAIAKADFDNSPSLTDVCTSTGSTYIVAMQLSNATYWCVDNTGIKKVTSRVPLTSDNTCP